jgi:hypothetical protein
MKPDDKSHIVLTHIKRKRFLILASPIFGYSGEDIHLNDIVSNYY